MSDRHASATKAGKKANRSLDRIRIKRRMMAKRCEELPVGMAQAEGHTVLPITQRQAMMTEVARTQGNGHLLRMVHTVQRDKQKPITTPLDETATINKKGAAELRVGEIAVVVMPDGHSQAKKMRDKAHTSFKLNGGKLQYKHKRGIVTEIIGAVPPPITVTIKTVYGPSAAATDPSAYGRGTTEKDKKAGNTSLGFHEGQHGLDFMAYLKKQPLPAFAGAVGMSVKEFRQAIKDYKAAIAEYTKIMDATSEKSTDCVGEQADFCVEHPQ